jgi:hypothetical protein
LNRYGAGGWRGVDDGGIGERGGGQAAVARHVVKLLGRWGPGWHR